MQIDHIHPYSRGGSTTPGNAQVLCAKHNRQKSAHIPYNWQVRVLERNRRSYFPADADMTVERRAAR